jgi:hypothetical protein
VGDGPVCDLTTLEKLSDDMQGIGFGLEPRV